LSEVCSGLQLKKSCKGDDQMTKTEALELQVMALEAQIDVLYEELHQLNLELDQADRDWNELWEQKQPETEEHVCRGCFVTFTGPVDQQWCSDDCRYFKRARPFEEYYAMLHPGGRREPDQALAAKA